MDVVTLPMYDLPDVRPATIALLTALAEELTTAGWPTSGSADPLGDHAAYVAHWLDPRTALSHSCGLPYVEELDGRVTIVGTFCWRGAVDHLGRYRSKVVVLGGHPARRLTDLRRARPVVNDPESLSGWCSLGAALADAADGSPTAGPFVEPFVVSGAHVASLEMLRAGLADVAAIDAITYRMLERHRPEALAGTRVLAEGPSVPATPLITRAHPPVSIDVVRDAVRRAIERPSLAADLRVLGIEGFVPLDRSDYLPLRELAGRAERALPRVQPGATP